jgi:hypothetical protein
MPELAPNGDDYGASFLTNSSGSLAMFAAIRLASSRVNNFAADLRPGQLSKHADWVLFEDSNHPRTASEQNIHSL